MELQQQGTNECVLATFAMLADKPLEEIRSRAMQLIRELEPDKSLHKWNTFIFWAAWENRKELVRVLATELLGESFARRTVAGWDLMWAIGGLTELPKSGKGQILIKLPLGRHSVAYENGIVYDPATGKMNEAEFVEFLKTKDGQIQEVIPVED